MLCPNSNLALRLLFLTTRVFLAAARMDGTRVSVWRAIQREVRRLQLRRDLVGAPDDAATMEWPRPRAGNLPSLDADVENNGGLWFLI